MLPRRRIAQDLPKHTSLATTSPTPTNPTRTSSRTPRRSHSTSTTTTTTHRRPATRTTTCSDTTPGCATSRGHRSTAAPQECSPHCRLRNIPASRSHTATGSSTRSGPPGHHTPTSPTNFTPLVCSRSGRCVHHYTLIIVVVIIAILIAPVRTIVISVHIVDHIRCISWPVVHPSSQSLQSHLRDTDPPSLRHQQGRCNTSKDCTHIVERHAQQLHDLVDRLPRDPTMRVQRHRDKVDPRQP